MLPSIYMWLLFMLRMFELQAENSISAIKVVYLRLFS